ncbi:MAG TPA: ATP-binding protein [Solirubrobacteraceae bacterium]|jgi:predicted AAA+ superfamily ATPase|nr:ATP-binding protein [Solirubrobacteraceae bacterium]
MNEAFSPISGIVARRLLEVTSERLEDEPVIALQGPRTVGKSTLLGELASAHGVEVVDLDEPATRAAVLADPSAFVGGSSPVCIDEYQHVPAVLDAIKAELNRELRPGRYVITGSTRYDALPIAAQSLTGRLHLLTVWPLTQGEIDGVRENLLAALLDDPVDAVPRGTVSGTSREEYIARITAGGMPIPLARRSSAARNRWFDDYVELVLERDVRELSRLRQREQLPALLRRLAAQTAGVLNVTRAAGEAGLDRTTAADYVKLLEAVFLVMRLPAWGTTVRARATSAPKIHMVDAGLAARLLGLTAKKLARRDAPSLSQFGHLLETFTVGELVRQASWLGEIAAYGHWRTYDGDEIDLVLERDDGGILAFEVKAAGQVAGRDMRHLRKLRDALGDHFLTGVALYTGTRAYNFEDRLHVIPIDRIWTPL